MGEFDVLKAKILAEIEEDAQRVNYPKNDVINNFLAWMKSAGANFDKLKIHHASATNRIVD